jgi:pyruvate dehydrogenase E1 component beta subunit
VPEDEYTIPLGVADIKRQGTDITVVANLLMLHRVINVAHQLQHEDGLSVEVIDPRCLVPLDGATIIDSVKKTGRLLVVEENAGRGGWGAQVVAEVAAHAIGYVDAPIRRLTAPDVPIPFAPHLEASVVPDESRIKQAIRALVRDEL